MLGFLRGLLDFSEVHRWRRRAVRDESPQSTIQLCRILQRQGRITAAMEAAREGLERYPGSVELRQILHATWKRSGQRKLRDLEAKVAADPSITNHETLVSYFLEFNEIDKAVLVAEKLVAAHPDSSSSVLLHGRVLVSRFHRDHIAADGALGLRSLHRAVELEPKGYDANFALAETYYYIGAISKALFHLYRAMDSGKERPEAQRLYKILTRLPLEQEEETDLLREIEERDEGRFKNEAEAKSTAAAASQRAEQLSTMAGVRRVALCTSGQDLVGKSGRLRVLRANEQEPFVELAAGFRRVASLSAKRMGIGAFQEAELHWASGRVLATAAGPHILLVETDASPKFAAIAAEARDIVAAVSASGKEAKS